MSNVKKISSPLRLSPQATPKIGKSERTRAAILNAALDFVWSHPFRDMTVNSLMASTDVGRSAFYQHFKDLYEVMEAVLVLIENEILEAANPWVAGVGDPVALLHESIAGLVRVVYQRGPFMRAIADAATTDKRFEKDWVHFLGQFDDATCARIEADQEQGLIGDFDVHPVAIALTRMDAYTLIQAFGQRPRSRPEPIQEALTRVWTSTLYGAKWVDKGSSNLIRK